MIVEVSSPNVTEWALLCTRLWPDYSMAGIITERAAWTNTTQFLYYVGDKAVGFINLSLRHDYVEGTSSSPVGYVEGIYVEPDYRGRGISAELVGYAKEWSMARGCTEMGSDCLLENAASRAFHQAVGFREAGVVVCFTMKLDS